jgi:hypothetical protein
LSAVARYDSGFELGLSQVFVTAGPGDARFTAAPQRNMTAPLLSRAWADPNIITGTVTAECPSGINHTTLEAAPNPNLQLVHENAAAALTRPPPRPSSPWHRAALDTRISTSCRFARALPVGQGSGSQRRTLLPRLWPLSCSPAPQASAFHYGLPALTSPCVQSNSCTTPFAQSCWPAMGPSPSIMPHRCHVPPLPGMLIWLMPRPPMTAHRRYAYIARFPPVPPCPPI